MLQFGDSGEMLKIKDIPYIKIVAAVLFVNIVATILVILLQPNLPPQVPLLYGRAYGEKQLVSSIGLITPSLVTILATLLNTLISYFLKEKLLQQILVTTSIIATILSLITTVKIIMLVGNI